MASRVDLIGLAMTDVLQPALVPTNGLTAMLGTNPIAFSAPAKSNRPFLLDMATTVVPVGKLAMAWRRGRSIPAGWALDDHGRPIRNPRKAIASRRLSPLGNTSMLGGHKGYGLAAMVEILSSRLSGDSRLNTGIGHFFLALDPRQFGDTDSFKNNMDVMIDNLRSSKAKTPGKPVQVAGDPEYMAAADRQKNGIPLTRCVIEDIRFVCRESGVPFLLDSGNKAAGKNDI
jgi:LDH2 family malate/lactate/ureidoglycolate dehydrogenase